MRKKDKKMQHKNVMKKHRVAHCDENLLRQWMYQEPTTSSTLCAVSCQNGSASTSDTTNIDAFTTTAVAWLVGWLLIGWMDGWLVGSLGGYLVDWLVGWFAGWLLGRLIGLLTAYWLPVSCLLAAWWLPACCQLSGCCLPPGYLHADCLAIMLPARCLTA